MTPRGVRWAGGVAACVLSAGLFACGASYPSSRPSAHRMPPTTCARKTGSLLQKSSRRPSEV